MKLEDGCISLYHIPRTNVYHVSKDTTYLRLMPSSHHQHRRDKTVLSCPRCEQNWQQVKTVSDRKFQNCFVQSRNAVRTTENSLDS